MIIWIRMRAATRRARTVLLSNAARPLRVIGTGSLAALFQIGVLHTLLDLHWNPIGANTVGLVLGAQVNFVLSYIFTWHDRRPREHVMRVTLGRWLAYQATTGSTMVLNIGVFVGARTLLPTLAAAVAATSVTAIANYILNDRLVFPVRNVPRVTDSPAPRHGRAGVYPRNEDARARGRRNTATTQPAHSPPTTP